MDWTWGWTALGTIATCILAASVFFAIWQIRQAKLSTNAQIAVELFRELRSEKILENLRFIYSLKPKEDVENLPDFERYNIGYVLDRFEILGALVAKKIINKKLAIETYVGQPALRCWYQLCQHYVKKEQDKLGYYHDNYEAFAKECLDYFGDNHIRVGLHNKYFKIENLVAEFQKDELKGLRPRNLKKIKRDRKKAWKRKV